MTRSADTMLGAPEHLAAWPRSDVVDTLRNPAFDRLTRLASALTAAPIALVSLVDGDRQCAERGVGLLDSEATDRKPSLSHSFCQHTVMLGTPLVVDDAREHPLLHSDIVFRDTGMIAYLGIPLTSSDGQVCGAFCVMDTQPRQWQPEQVTLMRDLAALVMTEIELRSEVLRRRDDTEYGTFQARIIERVHDIVIGTDSEFRIRLWNGAAEKVFGWQASEVLGKRVSEVVPVQRYLSGITREEAERLLLAHGIWKGDVVQIHRDGHEIIVEASVQILHDERGFPTSVVTISRDITERIQTEEQLRESEERLRFTMESAHIGYWDLNITQNTARRSLLHAQAFGYSDLLTPWNFDIFLAHVHPEDRERVAQSFQAARGAGEPYTMEFRVVWSDESVHWLLAIGRFAVGATSQPTHASGVVLDVTERKHQEESLRVLLQHSEQQSRIVNTVLSSISDFTYIFDREGCFVYANQALLELWGLTMEKVAGKDFFGLPYPHDQATKLQQQIQQVFKTRQGLTDQIAYTSRNGELGFYEYIFKPVVTNDGTVEMVVGSTRDITVHRRAEIAEREAHRFLQSTLDALASHIAVLDQDGTIIAVNKAWKQFAEDNNGMPQSCGMGSNYLKVCSGASGADAEEAAAVTAGIRAVMAGEQPYFGLEYPCHSPHEQRWFRMSVTHFGGEGPVRVVVAHENITARKHAEEALHVSEARYRTLIEHFPNGAVFLLDRDLRYVVAGGTGLAASGLSSEMVVGKTIWDVFPLGLAARDELILQPALRGLTTSLEVPFAEQVFLVRTLPVTDDEDATVGVLVMTQDITEQKRGEVALKQAHAHLEQRVLERTHALTQANTELAAEIGERQRVEIALRTSEQRYRSLLELAPDGIMVFDGQMTCIEANSRAVELLGYSLDQLRGKHVTDITASYDPQEAMEAITRPVPGASHTSMRVFQRKDGTTFPSEINSVILPGNMMQSIFRDITARTAVAEQLMQAKLEAEQANLAKSEFLSRMSHELRTPLNAILGFAQILEMATLTPRQTEGVGYILKGGRHLLAMINEVLDISRIEAGHLNLSLEPVVLDDVLREALDLVRPLATRQQVTLQLAETSGCGSIWADRQRMVQVLLNLLSNAIKYNHEGGVVTIACEPDSGQRLHILVSDTGPGIAPEHLAKLFTPFERLGAERIGIEGTGLGLALSRQLVIAMNGQLGLTSTPGVGSTFQLTLRRVEHTAQTLEQPVANSVGIADQVGAHGTVLYIEDNLSNLRLFESLLADRPGLHLLSAMHGRVGLDLAREHQPNLILLDLHLPDIQGDEVLHQLQTDPRTRAIPVVMLSADATPRQIERLLDLGAHAYLTKPIYVRRFTELLDMLLEPAEG